MDWKTIAVRDNGFWTDYVTVDNRYIIAQGYNEYERKHGKPFVLFECSKDRWTPLGAYSSLEEAKSQFKTT